MLALVAAVAGAAAAGYFLGRAGNRDSEPSDKAGPENDATVRIRTTPVAWRDMEQVVSAYGTVVPAPESVQTVSASFACRIRRVLVIPGQTVEAGQAIAEIEPSSEAALQVAEARSNRDSAQNDLQQVRRRAEMKLATKQELLQAEQALSLAVLRLDNLQKHGANVRRPTAPNAGVITKISVQEGDVVPPFSALAELVPAERIEARLGADPEDIDDIKPDQPVHVFPVFKESKKAIEGRVILVSNAVNPASRLVDVFVSLPHPEPVPLNTYVVGKIVVASRKALAIPRAAVLPEGEGYVAYTVDKGRAVRRAVRLGLENDDWVELADGGLKPGDPVVSSGNYELADGMAVTEETGK